MMRKMNDVFQLGELIDPYLIAHSNDLEGNSIFHITNKIFVDVDAKELNDILSSNGYIQVNEDDYSDKINVEDCDRDRDELIGEEEDNFD
jgi:hypothetical protein